MRFISKALCLLAVATIGLAAGIPFNEELREITLEDILNFEKNVQSVQIDTSDPLIVEEASLSVPEQIVSNGYGAEVHEVQTSDGYILELHRMTSSPRCQNVSLSDKQPVFLMHGLSGSSSAFVSRGKRQALSYMLADECYDVWIGNARGNRYARRHIRYNADGDRDDRRNFFDFSWHETGDIDIPNMIECVLKNTPFKRMHYVGHSQGTTAFFVMCSEHPEYNDKFISMHAMAPVAFWENYHHPLLSGVASQWNVILTFLRLMGLYEFAFDDRLLSLATPALTPAQLSTQTFVEGLEGSSSANTGTNNLAHYGQNIDSKLFRQFDHGTLGNLRRYGTAQPPEYNVRAITAPVALHYSLNDWLVNIFDVYKLYETLPNPIGLFQVQDPLFTHGDFISSLNVRPLLYNGILEIMRDFESKQ